MVGENKTLSRLKGDGLLHILEDKGFPASMGLGNDPQRRTHLDSGAPIFW